MANYIAPTYNDRVKYSLRNNEYGISNIIEPNGWNDDEKTFKRSTDTHGVFISLSNNLEFSKNGGGYEFILNIYKELGVNAVIYLVKEERNPITDIFEESYRGYLDLPTMSRNGKYLSVKFNETGIYQSIKARQSEDLELERLTTMDGDEIEPLEKQLVELKGRKIFLVSQLQLDSAYPNPYRVDFDSSHNYGATALPQTILSSSDDSVQYITDQYVNEITTSYRNGETGHMFYAIADQDKTLEITLDIDISWISNGVNTVRLDLVTYDNGIVYDFKNYQTLVTKTSQNGSLTYNNKLTVNLLAGESLTLCVHGTSSTNILYTWNETKTLIEEDSFYEKSQAEFVLPFEVLDRTLKIITNQDDVLVSSFLGRTDLGYENDGDGSLVGLTNGYLIRQFTDKSITTNFKDFNTSYGAIFNTGYGIEKQGFKEIVRFEKLEYFYQNFVTVRLPNQAKNIKRTVAADYIYNSFEFGSEKPSEDYMYEEAMGLDEYNTKATSTSIITAIEKKFSKISKYNRDSYGGEFARRQQIATDPTKDTRYDEMNFLKDLKRGEAEVFEERVWQDDFETEPTGVYSPETATNLRLSNMNILTRFGWWIRGGLSTYLDSYISYSSGIGNSELETQLIGKEPIKESGKIKVGDLDNNRFLPEIIEFEHECDYIRLKEVQGKTGDIMNYYGLVEFINEDNKLEYGYLLELQPNKEGKWKLLSSSKRVSSKKPGSIEPLPPIIPDVDDGFEYELNLDLN